jgi:holo-[acyl-carrier protein] synthase
VILGLGIDLTDVGRLRRAVAQEGESILDAFLSARERATCRRRRTPAAMYAAYFAAKEALGKALGTGVFGSISWHDVEVSSDERGGVDIRLKAKARHAADALGVRRIHAALGRDGELVAALVVLER